MARGLPGGPFSWVLRLGQLPQFQSFRAGGLGRKNKEGALTFLWWKIVGKGVGAVSRAPRQIPRHKGSVIPVQQAQEIFGYLPKDVSHQNQQWDWCSHQSNLRSCYILCAVPSWTWREYRAFILGTACHVRGAKAVLTLPSWLGLKRVRLQPPTSNSRLRQ